MAPPILRLARQNGLYTQPLRHGVTADATLINGSWLHCPHGEDLAIVLGFDQAAVEAKFAEFLADHPEIGAAGQHVSLDVEGPLWPPAWYLGATEADQNERIAAWQMRVAVARAALPAVELGAYGTLQPPFDGDATDAIHLARLAVMQRAHTEVAAFADLDVLTPTLYPRFGPGDSGWGTYAAYAALGVDATRAIGPNLPVKPWLHYRIFNTGSQWDDVELLDLPIPNPLKYTLDVELAVLEAEGVAEALFWVTAANSETIAGSGRSIYQYISPARPVVYYF